MLSCWIICRFDRFFSAEDQFRTAVSNTTKVGLRKSNCSNSNALQRGKLCLCGVERVELTGPAMQFRAGTRVKVDVVFARMLRYNECQYVTWHDMVHLPGVYKQGVDRRPYFTHVSASHWPGQEERPYTHQRITGGSLHHRCLLLSIVL